MIKNDIAKRSVKNKFDINALGEQSIKDLLPCF